MPLDPSRMIRLSLQMTLNSSKIRWSSRGNSKMEGQQCWKIFREDCWVVLLPGPCWEGRDRKWVDTTFWQYPTSPLVFEEYTCRWSIFQICGGPSCLESRLLSPERMILKLNLRLVSHCVLESHFRLIWNSSDVLYSISLRLISFESSFSGEYNFSCHECRQIHIIVPITVELSEFRSELINLCL